MPGKGQWATLCWGLWLVVVIVLGVAEGGVSGGCPLACICKWKGGKQTVSCRNQGLDSLPEGIDPETQVLDMSGNKLGVLPRDAFKSAGLLNLQKIHLSNSRLVQVDAGAFSELINLVEVDLSDNSLTTIPSQAFKETPFVRDLNLAGNSIKVVKNGAFRFLPQLVKLDLSRSHLEQIEDQAFAHLQILETLKLESNNLPFLSNSTVKSLSQLKNIEIHDNPWDCDCKLRHLKLWIETKNVPHPVSPTCHSPSRLAGRKFSELPLSEFACAPKILQMGGSSATRSVQVYEGDNATLECAFEAIPQPSVRWYLYGRPIQNNTLLSFSRKFLIFEDSWKSTLVLTQASLKDGGSDLFCVVENPAGFVEANFSLEILPPPPGLQGILETSQLAVVVLAVVTILLLLLVAVALFLWYRWRLGRVRSLAQNTYKGNGTANGGNGIGLGGVGNNGSSAAGTPTKPPRLGNGYEYEINPGGLVGKGERAGEDNNLNPDLILETGNNQGSYRGVHGGGGNHQDPVLLAHEEGSLSSELWDGGSLSFRNLGYTTEYPPDYGLPIIHENSVYSENSSAHFYPNGSVHNLIGLPLSGSGQGLHNSNSNGSNVSMSMNLHQGHGGQGQGQGQMVMSGVWNKNKVGARITAPNARDSPDEGYQEGYVGTDV